LGTKILPPDLQVARQEMSRRLLLILLSFFAASALFMLGTGLFLGDGRVIVLAALNLTSALAALYLQGRNSLQAAGVLVSFGLLFTGIYSTWTARSGIEDAAVIMYIVAAVLATLLLRNIFLRILMVIAVIALTVIGLRVQLGLVSTEFYIASPVQDFLLIIAAMVMITVGLRRINDDLWSTLSRAIGHEKQLTASNAALLEQTELAHGSEQRWRSLVEAAPEIVLQVDDTGRIVFANRDGLIPGRLEGRLLHEIVAADDAQKLTAALEKTRATGAPVQLEAVCGEGVDAGRCVFNLGPLENDGEMQGAIVLVSDITERLRLREQLLLSQKLDSLGRLAGGIAHDFNNLLTVISGHAEIADSKLEQGEDVSEDIAMIRKTGDRAADLTRQILAFGRRQPMRLGPIHLASALKEMDSLLGRLIGEDIRLEIDAEVGLPPILADSSQLEQVLTNLVLNARDAIHEHPSPQSRVIRVGCRPFAVDEAMTAEFLDLEPGDHVEISVSDTGTGMSPEVKKRLFEPFFTTKDPGRGTGLGLSTVYGIVNQSKAAIRIYSEPGLGTSFKIYWPVAVSDDSRPARPDGAAAKSRVYGTEYILLVEDDVAVLRLAYNALRNMGYRVSVATNGEEALDLLAGDEPYDIVVTDVVMPGINGFQLAKEVPASIPVLLTSGYAEEAWSSMDEDFPPENFLLKPYGPAELAAAIRRVLDS